MCQQQQPHCTSQWGQWASVEWACVLCGCDIQNDWVSRAMNLHQNLQWVWTFLCRNYLEDSERCSHGQLVIGNFIMTMCLLTRHTSCVFLVKHQITQGTQPPYSPELTPCDFLLFPKLKSSLKGRFQTTGDVQENTMGQLMVTERTVWGPKVPTLKETEVSASCVQCFLYLLHKCLYFSCHIAVCYISSMDRR